MLRRRRLMQLPLRLQRNLPAVLHVFTQPLALPRIQTEHHTNRRHAVHLDTLYALLCLGFCFRSLCSHLLNPCRSLLSQRSSRCQYTAPVIIRSCWTWVRFLEIKARDEKATMNNCNGFQAVGPRCGMSLTWSHPDLLLSIIITLDSFR